MTYNVKSVLGGNIFELTLFGWPPCRCFIGMASKRTSRLSKISCRIWSRWAYKFLPWFLYCGALLCPSCFPWPPSQMKEDNHRKDSGKLRDLAKLKERIIKSTPRLVNEIMSTLFQDSTFDNHQLIYTNFRNNYMTVRIASTWLEENTFTSKQLKRMWNGSEIGGNNKFRDEFRWQQFQISSDISWWLSDYPESPNKDFPRQRAL